MAISKLILNGVTQMDVTTDTVDAQYMVSGKTATKADGTKVNGSLTARSSSDLTVSGKTVTVPAGVYSSQATKSVQDGTISDPVATKGTVSNHTMTVTPSVSNTTGWVISGSRTGAYVSVSASELVSGTKSITENGTGIDVTNYASVDVAVPTGPKHTATITQGVSNRTNVKYNGVTYRTTNATFEFSAGDTCSLEAYGEMGGGAIYEDGTQIGSSDHLSAYTYTLPDCDVEFELQTNGTGRIDITKVSGSITVNPLSVTQNGTYTAPTGTAYSPVTVNVSGGGGDDKSAEIIDKTISAYENNSLTNVGSFAFCYCTQLSEVSLPSVSIINSSAFYGCSALTSIYAPSVTGIGINAFANCGALQQISFPYATYVSNYAFASASSLVSVYLPSLTSLGLCAFSKCVKLGTIDLPKLVSAGSSAFADCSKLSFASIPLLSSIAQYMFYNCSSLSGVYCPSATSIGTNAFYMCVALPYFSHSGIKTVGAGAFYGCSKMSYVNMPSVTSLAFSAFYNCWKLNSVMLDALTFIGASAFYGCSSLPFVSFPLVQQVSSSAFFACSSVSWALFSSLKSIGNYAFVSCFRLVSLYLLGSSVASLGTNVFTSTPMSNYSTVAGRFGSIFVPQSLYDAYRSATNWSVFSNRFASLTDAEIEALLT